MHKWRLMGVQICMKLNICGHCRHLRFRMYTNVTLYDYICVALKIKYEKVYNLYSAISTTCQESVKNFYDTPSIYLFSLA